jgi:Predicted integral membrane protein (DUF2269)
VIITLSAVVRAQRARDVSGVRAAMAAAPVAAFLIPPGMALILGCGLYLWSRHGDDGGIPWTSPWLITAVAVFAVMSVLGPTVEEGRAKRIVAAAAAAPDGPVPPELDRLRCDRLLYHVIFFGASQIVALVYLMSVKPGLAGALMTVAIAAAASQAIAALLHSGMRTATRAVPPVATTGSAEVAAEVH